MTILNNIALALIVIGGLNWGFVGLLDVNLVSGLFGVDTFMTNLVYALVGAAAVYSLYLFKPVTTGTRVEHHVHTTS